MSEKQKPYRVSWSGCGIISEWDEVVHSGTAVGVRSRIKYINKKGNEQISTKWVRWNK